YYYYKDFVVGKQNKPFYPGDITIAQWIGKFKPERINVIPLFEDKEHMFEAHTILEKYLRDKDIKHQRVFIARSDPAMNYGMISAILCNKIALQRLQRLSEKIGVETYPILGVGSAPFRGHLAPDNVARVLNEYPDVQTFTVQSAFKYDNPAASIISGIRKLKESSRKKGKDIDETRCIRIADKMSREYRRSVKFLAPLMNYMAGFVPRRRMRKLHVGLFGYSRSVGKVRLPRVISFCAAGYSVGLPPEIIGLNALTKDDIAYLREVYVNFDFDISTAMAFFNRNVLSIVPKEARSSLKLDLCNYSANEDHGVITSRIIKAVKDKNEKHIQGMLIEAAHIRRFLG
ncbi:MAG: phosphoenolpyruvate carboxylase, partial [Nitrospirota bacterium]